MEIKPDIKRYVKPKLKKHTALKQITFSSGDTPTRQEGSLLERANKKKAEATRKTEAQRQRVAIENRLDQLGTEETLLRNPGAKIPDAREQLQQLTKRKQQLEQRLKEAA